MKNLFLAGCLCLMVAVESTTIKLVKKKQVYNIPSEQLVLLVEIFKFLVSFALLKIGSLSINKERKNEPTETSPLVANSDNEIEIFDQVHEDVSADSIAHAAEQVQKKEISSNILWFIVPAALYAVSNNVTFAALALMSPAMFNLLMNLKIPMTALMAWAFIGYKVSPRLLISFVTLFVGSAIATIRIDKDGQIALEGSFLGLALMIVYASCSAGAAVYIEYLMKMRFGKENIHKQNIKFCICSAIANIIVIITRGELPFAHLEPIHLASVAALGFNGLFTAAVIKYGGSILKTYAVSVAMFLSALFTWLFFDYTLPWTFYFGAGICAVSVNLYAFEKIRK